VMIERPAHAHGETAHSVDEALQWIEARL
jgi:hypothetical protein